MATPVGKPNVPMLDYSKIPLPDPPPSTAKVKKLVRDKILKNKTPHPSAFKYVAKQPEPKK